MRKTNNKSKKVSKILTLQTRDWNKTPRAVQDKALLFMFRILAELSEERRKDGLSPEFFAEYP